MAQAEGVVVDLRDTLRLIPGYDPFAWKGDWWLDEAAAQSAINFFPDCLRHIEGDARGEPFVLEPWEKAIIGNIFGWKRKDEVGRTIRRYRRFLLYIGRGNGKTPLAAGICIYVLSCDQEAGAQCYLAAGQREQAGYLFRNARGMVEQEPLLTERIRVYGGDNNRCLILRNDPLSFCRVIPAEAAGQHGGIPHLVIVDELHVQESRALVDVFETGMRKKVRAQPLLGMLTTADFDRPSICNEMHARAVAIRDNHGDLEKPGYDPYFLPVVYEVPPEDDWKDEAVWVKANPNLGVTVSLENLRSACKEAIENPATENSFRRLNLNQKTGQDIRIIPMDAWDKCEADFELEDLKGARCFGGLDLASVEDLASFALVFPFPENVCKVLVWTWCPEEKIAARARQRIPYDLWARDGWIEATTEGNGQIDYAPIKERILSLKALVNLREVAYDQWNASQMVQDLEQSGLTMVKVPATFSHLSAPTKEIIRRVKMGTFLHQRNPVLRWAASNAAAKFEGKLPDGGIVKDYLEKIGLMISKKMSREKIDPISATVLAMSRVIAHPEAARVSIYETRGILRL